ncbi:MAG: hypothetical protein ACLQPH_15545 [Acidimicrobiales bacterium]
MALSFLYLAFVRTLQLLWRNRSDDNDLTIEVVMLRHEVAVLRRQGTVRPCAHQTMASSLVSASYSPG